MALIFGLKDRQSFGPGTEPHAQSGNRSRCPPFKSGITVPVFTRTRSKDQVPRSMLCSSEELKTMCFPSGDQEGK